MCSKSWMALYFALLASLLVCTGSASLFASGQPGPLPLKIVGTQIETSDGQPILLRGVNAASMEFTSDGEGHILTTVQTAIDDWHVNIIRLPLSEDRWFGRGPEQTDRGKAYRALIAQIVQTCDDAKCYIILDLHWSDEDQWGQNIGQHRMPDQHSILFWKDFAKVYANNPAVLFDLYNEPHDVPWDLWLSGGQVDEVDQRTGNEVVYEAAGMQQLLDTVRSTGARNVCVCGGLNWAYDYSGILAGRELSDPHGNGVVYSNHFYTVKGDTVDLWLAKMELAAKTIPVIVSEWGSAPPAGPRFGHPAAPPGSSVVDPWNIEVLKGLTDHGWSWTAWDLHPSAGPSLITDWSYTPSPTFGVAVKAALAHQPAEATTPSSPGQTQASGN